VTTSIIRAATAGDIPAVVALLADDDLGRSREDLSTPLNPAYLEAFNAIADDPNQLLVVMERNGTIVGCLQLSYLPGLSHRGIWRGQIEGVRIASSLRGGGLGRQLIEWAVVECRRRGCSVVQLTSSNSRVAAQRFYASLGFKASHVGMKLDL
jgi:ribosomal protein S18 acetylase RimI-like enzyme